MAPRAFALDRLGTHFSQGDGGCAGGGVWHRETLAGGQASNRRAALSRYATPLAHLCKARRPCP